MRADDASFVAFVRANSRNLYQTARMLTGSATAAEDLVQETLTALYPHWDRVDTADSPLAYVRRALTNRFVSSMRRGDHRVSPMLFDSGTGEAAFEAVGDRDLVSRLLGDLPGRQRAAVVLRYLEGLDDDQIARSLGCRPGTVRSLISRGMASMRHSWGQSPATTEGRSTR